MLEFEEDGRSCRQQINQQNRNCVTLRLLMTVLQHIVTFFYAVRRPLACCLTFEQLEAVKLHCKFIDFFLDTFYCEEVTKKVKYKFTLDDRK